MISRLRRFPPLFFLGLFPVVILLWAWADSVSHVSRWSRSATGASRDAIYIHHSSLVFERLEIDQSHPGYDIMDPFTGEGGFGDFVRVPNHVLSSPIRRLFPALGWTSSRPEPLGHSALVIPFWFILLTYQPLWLGLSFWQARRRHAKLRAVIP